MGWWLLQLVRVGCLTKLDRPLYPLPFQITFQHSQHLFRVIPASTLVDGDVNVSWSKVIHQFKYGCTPIASKDRFIVPVDARDEDFLAADVGCFDSQVLVLTCGDERNYVDDAEESNEEKGCSKDSGPRGSREAAKRDAYHDRSGDSKQRRWPSHQPILSFAQQQQQFDHVHGGVSRWRRVTVMP